MLARSFSFCAASMSLILSLLLLLPPSPPALDLTAFQTRAAMPFFFAGAGAAGPASSAAARVAARASDAAASAALTAIPTNHAHFHLPFEALGVLRTGSANYYRGAMEGESEADFVARRADELESLILAEGPDTIAAMIAEPVSGAGGVIVPPAGYFEAIQAVLDRYGIWLWDDEVICGFGRLGTDFGANKMAMRPQMMTLAKALSSAYVPVSAAIVQGDIADCINASATEVGVFGHGYTYSGHPLGCAVASKVIDIYVRDRIFDHAAEVGSYLQSCLAGFADHPLVGEVSGVGMIGALELVADKDSKQPFEGMKVGQFCAKAAEDNGLVIRPLGGNRVALCPPLIIGREHVDEIGEKLGAALNTTLDWVTAQGLR